MARLELIWWDVRHAARALVSGRLFTVVAVLCLTLGISTNTTIFSVFDAMFWRPLPFADPDRLVSVAGRDPQTNRRVALSLDDVRQLASTVPSLAALAVYTGRSLTLNDGGEPERVSAQLVSANLFSTLGVAPGRGRSFDATEDQLSAPGVAAISDALWHRRFQADPAAIGRVIRLDNLPYTIVGVMPPTFRFPGRSDCWIPVTPALGPTGAASRSVSLVGRLAPATTLAQANAEFASRVLVATASRGTRRGAATALRQLGVGEEERTITGALMGATTVLVLIACANVANLLLARGAQRRREIALRSALGASRSRVVRQLLLESVLLALVAGVVALPLAWAGIEWVRDGRARIRSDGAFVHAVVDGRSHLWVRPHRGARDRARVRDRAGTRRHGPALAEPVARRIRIGRRPRPTPRPQHAHRGADRARADAVGERVLVRSNIHRAQPSWRWATTRRT